MRKVLTVLGLAAGLLLVAASLAHYFGGWIEMERALASSGATSETVGSLWAGWLFGSFAMAGTGVMVVNEALGQLRGRPCNRVIVASIALIYGAFGVTAWIGRDFRPELLVFVATGGWVALLLAGRPGDVKR